MIDFAAFYSLENGEGWISSPSPPPLARRWSGNLPQQIQVQDRDRPPSGGGASWPRHGRVGDFPLVPLRRFCNAGATSLASCCSCPDCRPVSPGLAGVLPYAREMPGACSSPKASPGEASSQSSHCPVSRDVASGGAPFASRACGWCRAPVTRHSMSPSAFALFPRVRFAAADRGVRAGLPPWRSRIDIGASRALFYIVK